MADRKVKCPKCGAPIAAPQSSVPPTNSPTATHAALPARAPTTSGLAISSLVCGIIGLCTFGLGGLVGLVLGIIGILKIGKSDGQLKGKGLAIGGIVASALSLILGLLLGLFFATVIFRSELKDLTVEKWKEALRDETSKIQITTLTMKCIETAFEAYNVNIGHYPNEQEGGLEALRTKPSFDTEAMGQNWRGPYLNLKVEPTDSWGNKFNYQLSRPGTPEADLTPFKLWSNGPDGISGTADDIKNWSDATTGK